LRNDKNEIIDMEVKGEIYGGAAVANFGFLATYPRFF